MEISIELDLLLISQTMPSPPPSPPPTPPPSPPPPPYYYPINPAKDILAYNTRKGSRHSHRHHKKTYYHSSLWMVTHF